MQAVVAVMAAGIAGAMTAAVAAYALARAKSRRLRDTASELDAILRANPDAVVLADDTGTILRVNPAVSEIFGWEERELIGKNASVLAPEPIRSEHAGYMRRYMETGEPSTSGGLIVGQRRESAGRRRSGDEFPIDIRVDPCEGEGGQRHYIAVIRDISDRVRADAERRRMLDELNAQTDERRRLIQQLMVVQEQEQHRIAYDIHDGPAQQLAGADMLLETFMTERQQREDDHLESHLATARVHLRNALQGTRRIMSDLRPALLDDLGLTEALRSWLGQQEESAGVAIEFDASGGAGYLDASAEVVLFRLVQEGVGNALRHSGSDRVAVRLAIDPGETILTVRDWGRGFDPAAISRVREEGRHLGLVGMRERTELLSGVFDLDAAPGRGTSITVRIPAPAGAGTPAHDQAGDDDRPISV